MLLEYWELGRSELNTPGDMGGEKNDRVAGDPHRRLRVNIFDIILIQPPHENVKMKLSSWYHFYSITCDCQISFYHFKPKTSSS